MTSQARIAAGTLEFLELPAGMVDDQKDFAGAAANEIREEIGMVINKKELVDMTALAMEGERSGKGTPKGMFPSAGGCDEFVTLYLYETKMEGDKIEALKGKLTGLREEGEMVSCLSVLRFVIE